MTLRKNDATGRRQNVPGTALWTVLFAVSCAQSLWAHPARFHVCTGTARAGVTACRNDVRDDFWESRGKCLNESDPEVQEECFADALEEFKEGMFNCSGQWRARLALCRVLGEDAYDPHIDPEEFVDFEAVISGDEVLTPNPFFALRSGNTAEYLVSEDGVVVERVFVEVLEETREILGVNCIVVRDRVWEVDEEGEEELIEDTKDWLGQHRKTGDVWYFGEAVEDFEDGDLVSLDGSFEAGKDHAKAGIWVLAAPAAGDVYRQEWAFAEAEDFAEVISVGKETVTVPFGTYSEGVLVTKDSTPLEPGAFEFKYYAPGVGLILEVDPESGDRLELVDRVVAP